MTRKRTPDAVTTSVVVVDDIATASGDVLLLQFFEDQQLTAATATATATAAEGSSDSSPSPPSPESSHSASAGESPAPPRVRKRRRHEVLRLQAEAAALERALSRLTGRQLQQLQYQTGARGAAMCAIQAATRARLENLKLREALAVEAELTRAFQETVTKRRPPIDVVAELESHSEQSLIPLATSSTVVVVALTTPRERAIYDQLSQSIDARVSELVPFARPGGGLRPSLENANWLQQDETIEVTMALNDHKCVCIDLVQRYILPFDFRAGAHVVWTHVLSKISEIMSRTPTQREVIAHSNDVLVTKQSTCSNYFTDTDHFTTEYVVSKRFLKANSVEFLWDSVVESTGSVSVSSESESVGMQLVQEGWGSVAHAGTASGHSTASILEAYVRLTPSMIATEADVSADPSKHHVLHVCPRFDVSHLSTVIVASYRRNAMAIRRVIENRLIDDMLHAAK